MVTEQPYAGVNVVEFGQFIAVPYCAQLLVDGGASVIKVEPLGGDAVRQLSPVGPGESRGFLSRNRGKRTLPLDLRHSESPRVIDALLARADVTLMNFRPGLAEKLGLGAAELVERYPRLVVGTVTPFGKRGAEAMLPGMDVVVQARSGLIAANGRVVDGRPTPPDYPSVDYATALALAFGIASALLRRERTGRGGEVDVSLMQSAMTLGNNQLLRVDAIDGAAHKTALAELARRRVAGADYQQQRDALPSARATDMTDLYVRTYRTQDGFIVVSCGGMAMRRRFLAALGLGLGGGAAGDGAAGDGAAGGGQAQRGAGGSDHDALRVAAEAAVAARSTVEWLRILSDAGIPASDVKFPIELFDDEQALANGMFHDMDHPSLGSVRVLTAPVSLDGDGFRPSPACAPFGSEARDILRDIGFGEDDVNAFVADGVTRESFA